MYTDNLHRNLFSWPSRSKEWNSSAKLIFCFSLLFFSSSQEYSMDFKEWREYNNKYACILKRLTNSLMRFKSVWRQENRKQHSNNLISFYLRLINAILINVCRLVGRCVHVGALSIFFILILIKIFYEKRFTSSFYFVYVPLKFFLVLSNCRKSLYIQQMKKKWTSKKY